MGLTGWFGWFNIFSMFFPLNCVFEGFCSRNQMFEGFCRVHFPSSSMFDYCRFLAGKLPRLAEIFERVKPPMVQQAVALGIWGQNLKMFWR